MAHSTANSGFPSSQKPKFDLIVLIVNFSYRVPNQCSSARKARHLNKILFFFLNLPRASTSQMSRANTRQSLNNDQTYLIQGRHTRTPQINAKRLSSISASWGMFKLSKKNFDIFAPCLALQLGKKRASCLLSR